MLRAQESSVEEREKRLFDAARKYLAGELSPEDYDVIQRKYQTDYKGFLISQAERRLANDAKNRKRATAS